MAAFSSSLALAMAAMVAEPAEDARIAYSNCIIDVVNEHLERKDGKSAFEKAAAGACSNERAAFHAIIVKEEKGYGSSQAEADQYADEEVQGIVDSFVEGYRDYLNSNSRPAKEKGG